VLQQRGASFLNDLKSACSLDAEDTRLALGTLVASGLAASDGFSGLRGLIRESRVHDRRALFAGRWSAVTPPGSPVADNAAHGEAVEAQAWALLRRYGVVFRRLLTRESIAAPWRELARVYRRLEARGEIRGGRFVSGMSGEQFALPRAVERLREVRRTPADGRFIVVSAADPLNLIGIVTAGDRIRAAGRNRVAYRDGVPVAVLEGDQVRALASVEPTVLEEATRALERRRAPALLR
jgi:ATP-dependent helicase Lhr and Lhr-like helicase